MIQFSVTKGVLSRTGYGSFVLNLVHFSFIWFICPTFSLFVLNWVHLSFIWCICPSFGSLFFICIVIRGWRRIIC